MKRWILILALYFIWFPAQGQLPALDLMDGRKSVQIPFNYYFNFILIEVRLQGVLPVKLILDTGAGNSILFDKNLTDLLRMEYDQQIKLRGADHSQEIPASITRRVALEFPKQGIAMMDLIVLDENIYDLSSTLGRDIHGIIGANFFKGLIVEINYRRRFIEITRPEKFIPPGRKWTSLPFELIDDKPYVNCVTQVESNKKIDLTYLLDTGSSLPAMLHNNTHPALNLPDQVLPGYLATGLGGAINGYHARVDEIQLDQYKIKNLIIGWQRLDSMTLVESGMKRNGVLGNPVLRKFNVILDYAGSRLYLKPNRYFDDPLKEDRSGLVLYAGGGKGLNDIYVKSVLPNSPADRAGVRVGDQIIKMNGWSTRWVSLARVIRKFQGKAGKTVKVTGLRKGKKYKAKIELSDLL